MTITGGVPLDFTNSDLMRSIITTKGQRHQRGRTTEERQEQANTGQGGGVGKDVRRETRGH